MADDKIEAQERTWRSLLPWTTLFRGFQLALDLNKLLLAAAGILVMSFGWWLLALIFGLGYGEQPRWETYKGTVESAAQPDAWEKFKRDRREWDLMHEAAGAGKVPDEVLRWEVADIAPSLADYTRITQARVKVGNEEVPITNKALFDEWVQSLTGDDVKHFRETAPLYAKLGQPKFREQSQDLPPSPEVRQAHRVGQLYAGPWSEDRGPNPFLLATGQVGAGVPWEAGHFWDWFVRDQAPVMIEPLVKVVRPMIYFFDPRGTAYTKFYFVLVMLCTIVTWSIFGGAITRIAAVQATRGEKIGAFEALRFVRKRLMSYIMAPLFPLLFLFALTVLMVLFGWLVVIWPFWGDFIAGFFWIGLLILGLIMAVVLVGLVGWPLMSATISTEGTDSWEAVSRSYSYVYQKPWQYIWYSLVAICYGAVLVFFVGFMGSLTVYLSKWGVAETPGISWANRDPSFLFVYAPKSFGWRALLLQGAKTDGADVVEGGMVISNQYDNYLRNFHWWNYVGAGLMAIWMGLLFLLIIGFGYSYFWCAGTLIYLLMRRSVDAAEMDEVYLEEEEPEGSYTPPSPAAPPAHAVKPGSPLTMVEAPALRSTPVGAPAGETAPPSATPADRPASAEPTAPTSHEPPPPSPSGGTGGTLP
jgi:hypothetical protein